MENKFTIKHYQNTRIKPYKGTKEKIHPVYIRIQYQRSTYNIRSPLFDSIISSDGRLEYGYSFDKKTTDQAVKFYFSFKIEQVFKKNNFEVFCRYEEEIIHMVKNYIFKQQKEINVPELIRQFNYLGQDALTLVSKNLLENICKSNSLTDTFKEIVQNLLKEHNPKRIVLFLAESGFLENTPTKRLDETLESTKHDMSVLMVYLKNFIYHAGINIAARKIVNVDKGFFVSQFKDEAIKENWTDKELIDAVQGLKETAANLGLFIYNFPVVMVHQNLSELEEYFESKLKPLILKYLPFRV